MAKEYQRLNKINLPSFLPLCVALLCTLQYHQSNGIECESDNYLDDLITPRILDGRKTDGGEWPFIAALLFRNTPGSHQERLFCGGTLVSNRHILTAAHCIQQKDTSKALLHSEIVVLLGAYNLACEENVVQKNVADIQVHPDWIMNGGGTTYDADVAILVLSEYVTITTDIAPISLPVAVVDSSTSPFEINGTIVGWGVLESSSRPSEILKQAVIQTYSDSYCFHTFTEVQSLKSARSFCAGSKDGSPSKGDSGGGFFVKIDNNWVQYGIISSIRTDDRARVIKNLVAVYTNVYSFRNWITETIENSGGVVGAPISNITLRCAYSIYALQYECHFHDLNISTENIAVTSVTGLHYPRKTEEDVKSLYFESGTMLFLPYGVGNMFKNLRAIYVKRKLGTKYITRSKLVNFRNLEELHFEKNDIEVLRLRTLWDLPALKIFRLIYNKIEVLHKRTFEKNLSLREVDLRSNQLKDLPEDLFKTNTLLEKVDLGGNFFTNIQTNFLLPRIKKIYLGNSGCINAYYSDEYESDDSERIETLRALQLHIRNRCQPS